MSLRLQTSTIESSYDKLKSAFIQCVDKQNQEVFDNILVTAGDHINSPRRLAQIHNATQLMDVLERRGILRKYDVTGLDYIRELIGDDGLNIVFNQYRSKFCQQQQINKINLYEKQLQDQNTLQQELEHKARIKAQEIENNTRVDKPQGNYCSAVHFEGEVKRKIYKLIAEEIGRNFRDLGRHLMVKEGELDNIETEYRCPKDRAYHLFPIYEDRVDPRKIVVELCNALTSSRRSDIRRKIESILSR